MSLDTLGAFTLILSLFLCIYNIRSLVFFRISKKMVRQNQSLQDNNNYFFNSLFKIESEDNSYLYYDSNIASDKDVENMDDTNARIMQKVNNVSTNSDSKGLAHKKPGYNNDTSNICYPFFPPSPPTSYAAPFISILVPAHNERLVIDRLMRSCATLTYNRDNFEIIIVDDDSEDGTFDIVRKWTDKIPNLKVIRRNKRTEGWKGGVLNLALKNMNINSSYVLVVDADNILISDILERLVSCFKSSTKYEGNSVNVIQGYPRPLMYYNSSDTSVHNSKRSSNISSGRSNINWVARAIDFRLAQRHMIEFAAKDSMNLPLQIVGSLFMIRSEIIKSIGFSNDLSEDWDLTLNLYLSPYPSFNSVRQQYCGKSRRKKTMIIRFDPSLVSYYEPITSIISYLRQRMRVSEGHTRGFRRKIMTILSSKTIRFTDKIELLFTGLQYVKFIPLLGIIVIDFYMILLSTHTSLFYTINNNGLVKLSLLVQAANLFTAIGITCMSIPICRSIRNYNTKDALYFLFLSLLTVPFVIFGSLRGIIRNEGIFYRTKRNS
jgi:cellulose synthase/poly-beta-1,6-N-acetylglucosamine synthase-like glycosyltransferase